MGLLGLTMTPEQGSVHTKGMICKAEGCVCVFVGGMGGL